MWETGWQGMNSNEMQKANRSLVLKILLENGSMTRTELSGRVGLQKATITNIINEFIELGIIGVIGDAASGRRGEQIGLQMDGIFILSMSVNRKEYQIRLWSSAGETVEQIKTRFDSRQDIHAMLNELKDNVLKLFEKYGKENIIGISLGLPGPYIRRENDDSVELNIVSQFEQLSFVNIHKELERALDIVVLSEHDAKLSAYAEWKRAEKLEGNSNASLLTFTSIGMGIGAGIIIDGKIVEGQLGVAGEIGHMGINYNGRVVDGQYDSSFEYCAGTESCIRYVYERLYEFPESVLSEKSTYHDIINAYQKGDALATYAVEKMAWMLGYGITNLIYILNPSTIIIGQEYPDYAPFLEKVQQTVAQFVHPSILEGLTIQCSKIKSDTVLLGGYYLILDQLIKNNQLLTHLKRYKKAN